MPNMRNIKTILSYDGSGYHGWQFQAGPKTVQETFEKALSTILKQEIRVISAGRTDAGVHAVGQVINFHTKASISEEALMRAMNSALPRDIRVTLVEEVGNDFHARICARSKTYVYVIERSENFSPFLVRYALHVPGKLDLVSMKSSAGMILGEHDFSSFKGSGSTVKTNIRTILVSELFTRGSKLYFFIEGSGFLRHMVRNVIGTLLLIGQGKMEPDAMQGIIEGKDRALAGPTAPAQGLYLVGVRYADSCPAKDVSSET